MSEDRGGDGWGEDGGRGERGANVLHLIVTYRGISSLMGSVESIHLGCHM